MLVQRLEGRRGGSRSAGSARSRPTRPARRRRRPSRPGRPRACRRRSRTSVSPVDGSSTANFSPLDASRHSPPISSCVGTSDRTFFSRSLMLIGPPSRFVRRVSPGTCPPAPPRLSASLRCLKFGGGTCDDELRQANSDDRARRHGRRSLALPRRRTPTGPSRATASATAWACASTAPTATPQQGVGYQKILRHYYTGTDLGSRSRGQVRVLLGESGSVGVHGRVEGLRQEPREALEVQLRRRRRRGRASRPPATSSPDAAERARPRTGSRSRATAPIAAASSPTQDGGDLLVINSLGSEDYVQGVVANESRRRRGRSTRCAPRRSSRAPTGSPRRAAAPFDQYDDTRSQVYGGMDSETKETNQAVRTTAQAGRHVQGRPRAHLLLLDLRRSDRERRVRLRRRQRDRRT